MAVVKSYWIVSDVPEVNQDLLTVVMEGLVDMTVTTLKMPVLGAL